MAVTGSHQAATGQPTGYRRGGFVKGRKGGGGGGGGRRGRGGGGGGGPPSGGPPGGGGYGGGSGGLVQNPDGTWSLPQNRMTGNVPRPAQLTGPGATTTAASAPASYGSDNGGTSPVSAAPMGPSPIGPAPADVSPTSVASADMTDAGYARGGSVRRRRYQEGGEVAPTDQQPTDYGQMLRDVLDWTRDKFGLVTRGAEPAAATGYDQTARTEEPDYAQRPQRGSYDWLRGGDVAGLEPRVAEVTPERPPPDYVNPPERAPSSFTPGSDYAPRVRPYATDPTDYMNPPSRTPAIPTRGGTSDIAQLQQRDLAGYLRGDNAIPQDDLQRRLDAAARAEPALNPNQLNAKVLENAYKSDNRDDASGVMAAQRQRYDNLIAKAQGAYAHGDIDGSLRMAAQAHEQIADGSTLGFHRADDGSITANVTRPGGESTVYSMTPSQFHSYLIGPATSVDHLVENGVAKHLDIASSQPDASGNQPTESLGSRLRYGALIAGGVLRGLSPEQIQSQLRQLGYAEPQAPQPATAGGAGPTFATTGYTAAQPAERLGRLGGTADYRETGSLPASAFDVYGPTRQQIAPGYEAPAPAPEAPRAAGAPAIPTPPPPRAASADQDVQREQQFLRAAAGRGPGQLPEGQAPPGREVRGDIYHEPDLKAPIPQGAMRDPDNPYTVWLNPSEYARSMDIADEDARRLGYSSWDARVADIARARYEAGATNVPPGAFPEAPRVIGTLPGSPPEFGYAPGSRGRPGTTYVKRPAGASIPVYEGQGGRGGGRSTGAAVSGAGGGADRMAIEEERSRRQAMHDMYRHITSLDNPTDEQRAWANAYEKEVMQGKRGGGGGETAADRERAVYEAAGGTQKPPIYYPPSREAAPAARPGILSRIFGGGTAGGQVRVTSVEEARKLPSGTPIILPDGRTGTVP